MTQRNPLTQETEARESAVDVDTDGSGDVVITVGGLRQIEEVADVVAQATGGYVANVQSVSGNDVTVRVYEGGGAASELGAVTGGSDVTDINVRAVGQ